ncbi:amidohydrolase family protein [Myxococcus stipitatus]|uniref:amidohydrolase family protein n=1 Tax=Myxococcus stipitatus TaxID=83455 RepID=UPI0031453647
MRAIDAWVSVNMGSGQRPEFLVRVAEDYFKRAEHIFRDISQAELLELMERTGVQKAILTVDAEAPRKEVLAFAEARPDRFALSAYVDPRRGMKALRELEQLARNSPLVLARAVPFMIGLPADDRAYYPLYTRCIDLGLPISVNTGIPGPPMPGRCQDPMNLDEVCYFFPELKLIMAHGADPWWAVAIRLMIKYPNLYLMTSAFAPAYLPAELIHFMNTRGRDKVLYASNHPVLPLERCLREAQELDLREGVLDRYLYGNAHHLFFEGRS